VHQNLIQEQTTSLSCLTASLTPLFLILLVDSDYRGWADGDRRRSDGSSDTDPSESALAPPESSFAAPSAGESDWPPRPVIPRPSHPVRVISCSARRPVEPCAWDTVS
jgi:hypothetical protein